MRTINKNTRRGFTLVELTVVILIIGVIATIAAPKFFDSLTSASEKSASQSLQVVRDAIELFKANNTGYPGVVTATEAGLKADLADFIRNDFPNCQVGKKDSTIMITLTGDPLSGVVDGSTAWAYDNVSGEFRINHADYIAY